MDGLGSIVELDWLKANFDSVTLIDCTWTITAQERESLPIGYIPGALEFDLSAIKALPLMRQTEGVIAEQLSKLGVSANDEIIVYDRHGVFSAPRLWWLLKTLGHENVAILNGGLPAWIAAGGSVVEEPAKRNASNYQETTALLCGSDFSDVLKAAGTPAQIVDARPPARFHGTTPEPRAGLRSGHIPGALNLPFGSLREDGRFKPNAELAAAVGAAGIDMDRPIITSCGSGVTAAGLALVFHALGKTDISVYSGSWAEYGASDAPIET